MRFESEKNCPGSHCCQGTAVIDPPGPGYYYSLLAASPSSTAAQETAMRGMTMGVCESMVAKAMTVLRARSRYSSFLSARPRYARLPAVTALPAGSTVSTRALLLGSSASWSLEVEKKPPASACPQ